MDYDVEALDVDLIEVFNCHVTGRREWIDVPRVKVYRRGNGIESVCMLR